MAKENTGRNVIVRNIPNFLTSITVFCGFAQMVGDLIPAYSIQIGGALIYLGLITDVLDGTAARMLNVKSPIGANFDQLADLMCFGTGPAILFARTIPQHPDNMIRLWFVACSFLYVLAGVWRIAREITNLKGAKPTVFIGIPTNLAALVVVPAIIVYPASIPVSLFMVVLSYMMCSTYPVPKGLWIIDIKE